MVAEVNGPSLGVVTALTTAQAKADKPVAPAAPPAGVEDVVQITELGTRLQELSKAVADVPQVDRARVDQLRQSLLEGNYQVDAKAVAEKLLALDGVLGNPKDA